MTEVIKTTNNEMPAKVAELIRDLIKKTLENQERVLIAIPGGRSVAAIFNELKTHRIEWRKVHFFMVDERLVPIDHIDSNFRLANETLLDELVQKAKLPFDNIHAFNYDKNASDSGIGRYQEELEQYGSHFDIVLLSSGEDGHIGAIYPNHHSFEDEGEYFILTTNSPKPPASRMSSSRKLIGRSSSAIILFMSETKREAFAIFNDCSFDSKSCPAKIVQDIVNSYVVSDLV
jgi:6-phosphogluconolactonase